MKDVLDMLSDVSLKWRELGLALGLRKPTLNEIYANCPHDVSSCKREMLSKWLNWVDKCETTCNWKSLAGALRDVDHAPIAAKIEKKFSIN